MILDKIRRLKDEREQGFTLIELLVVILIIGVLSAIAIPAFMNQRKEAVDASVKADLRTTVLSYETWRSKGQQNSNAEFRNLSGGKVSMWAAHENASFTDLGQPWNDVSGIEPIYLSDGTYANIVVITGANSTWRRVHDEGEHCTAANNVGSSYDFVTNTGMGAANYHRTLYYDKALGGIKTAEQIANAMANGEKASCDGQIGAWMVATGRADTRDAYWAKFSEV